MDPIWCTSGVSNGSTGDGHHPLMSYNPHMITSWDGQDPVTTSGNGGDDGAHDGP
jgi:hypothetical protein